MMESDPAQMKQLGDKIKLNGSQWKRFRSLDVMEKAVWESFTRIPLWWSTSSRPRSCHLWSVINMIISGELGLLSMIIWPTMRNHGRARTILGQYWPKYGIPSDVHHIRQFHDLCSEVSMYVMNIHDCNKHYYHVIEYELFVIIHSVYMSYYSNWKLNTWLMINQVFSDLY